MQHQGSLGLWRNTVQYYSVGALLAGKRRGGIRRLRQLTSMCMPQTTVAARGSMWGFPVPSSGRRSSLLPQVQLQGSRYRILGLESFAASRDSLDIHSRDEHLEECMLVCMLDFMRPCSAPCLALVFLGILSGAGTHNKASS